MNFNQYFIFNKEQKIGLAVLIGLIISMQFACLFVHFSTNDVPSKQQEQWLALQTEIDSLKLVSNDAPYKVYPFNPNFISDFKGYKLGMNLSEIDRLLAFRKTNKYVNSAQEFQNVTKVSDSLLATIAPYFKFPDWVNNKKSQEPYENKNYKYPDNKQKNIITNINEASKEDLMKIYGIGAVISERILKQKEVLGSFVSMSQMEDIWGLSPEVIIQLNTHFRVSGTTTINKININNFSAKELSTFPYFKYALAKEIVTYRSMNNSIKDLEDLTKIKGFPLDKIKIIALYLEF